MTKNPYQYDLENLPPVPPGYSGQWPPNSEEMIESAEKLGVPEYLIKLFRERLAERLAA